jgi:hypothetical protein
MSLKKQGKQSFLNAKLANVGIPNIIGLTKYLPVGAKFLGKLLNKFK